MADICVEFRNGVLSPRVQLGTYRVRGPAVRPAVVAALEAGYRGIDTASAYRNHTEIRAAVWESLPGLGLAREDIFLTSKLAPAEQGEERCEAAVERCLAELGTNYLDLFLIHWPGGARLPPRHPDHARLRAESWAVLERLHDRGTLRAIGVSNYTVSQLEQLLATCSTPPHVLQTELHPHYQQSALVSLARARGIHVQAYSSLGQNGPTGPLWQSEAVQAVARRLGRSPAQVLLRWGIQHGYTVMPKSVHQERIRENFDLSFEIPTKEMELLNKMEKDCSEKYAWDPSVVL